MTWVITRGGIPIVAIVARGYKQQEYDLLDANGNTVDTITRVEFLSNPNYRRLPNGRHRSAHSKNHGGSNSKSSSAGGSRTLTITQYPTRTALTGAQTGPGGLVYISALPNATWRLFNPRNLLPPRPQLQRETFACGEIIGYRCWRVENGLLRSVYQDDWWRPEQALEGRGLEDWGSRGIHAWKDPGSECYFDYIRSYLNIDQEAADFYNRNPCPALATGTVALWGDVVEHERGYRGEFARVRSIDWLYPDQSMLGREPQVLAELRSKYHV